MLKHFVYTTKEVASIFGLRAIDILNIARTVGVGVTITQQAGYRFTKESIEKLSHVLKGGEWKWKRFLNS